MESSHESKDLMVMTDDTFLELFILTLFLYD